MPYPYFHGLPRVRILVLRYWNPWMAYWTNPPSHTRICFLCDHPRCRCCPSRGSFEQDRSPYSVVSHSRFDCCIPSSKNEKASENEIQAHQHAYSLIDVVGRSSHISARHLCQGGTFVVGGQIMRNLMFTSWINIFTQENAIVFGKNVGPMLSDGVAVDVPSWPRASHLRW